MKTEQQIKEWMINQKWYKSFEENIKTSNMFSKKQGEDLLDGKLGFKTIQYALYYIDPKAYNINLIKKDFTKWYNEQH